MYKKNSLIFALGTKVIAVFPLCILLHVFMRNRKKRVEGGEGYGNVRSGFPVPSPWGEFYACRIPGWC